MIIRRSTLFPLSVLSLVSLVSPVRLSGQTPVIQNLSDLPVDFLSVNRSEASIPELLEFTLRFRNVSESPIFAIAFSWIFEDANGQLLRGGEFTGSFSMNPDEPLVLPGQVGSVTARFPATTAEQYPRIRPTLDFVLLGDGTFTGPNRSLTFQRAQTTFQTKRLETQRILDQLGQEAPQLARELAKTLDDLNRLAHVYVRARPIR